MSKRFLIAFVVVWTAAIGLAGFSMLRPDGAADPGQQASSSGSGGEQTQVEQQQAEQRQTSQQASGERGGEGTGEAVAKNETSPGGSESGEVALKLGGEPGVAFSGRCVVDGETRQISGETPQTFTYEPDERIECEITSQGGPLRVDFSDGQGTNTTQSVGPGPSTLELTYTGNSLSSSTSSQGGSSQASSSSQKSSSQTSSSQAGSSQSIVQQSSSSVTHSGAE